MTRIILSLGLFFAAPAVWPNGAAGRVTGAQSAPRAGQPENRWRYVWHNDRWWYWTAQNRWAYFNGGRWVNYDPRRPSTGALAAGYRRAPAFESPPAVPPRAPRSLPAEAAEADAGLVDLFDLSRQPGTTGSFEGLLPTPSRPGALSGSGALGAAGGEIGGRPARATGTGRGGMGVTGGGGFGGPTGSSLGAGSAAGGASTPQ